MPHLDWLTARPVAHRGLHDVTSGIIENTVSAFSAAVASGYGIELDLRITADAEAVVHHDRALGRLTEGSGRLSAMTVAELKGTPFKATADRIATLGEVCDLVAGRVTLLLELKGDDEPRRLAARVASILSTYSGPVAVMSFDPFQIDEIRRLAPDLPRGIVAERHLRSPLYIAGLVAARPSFVAYSIADLPAIMPFLARTAMGMPVLTWTVRSERDRARAARFADQMIFEGFRP